MRDQTFKNSKLSCYGITVFLLVVAITAASAQVKEITLKEAIAITLLEHPNSTIARNSASAADLKVKEARGALLPSVTLNATSDYNIKLPTTIIPAGSFSSDEIRMQMGRPFSSTATVQAELPLYDKSALTSIGISKIDKDIADLNVLKENETLLYNTARAYFEALSVIEETNLLVETKRQNEEIVKILKLRFEQGVAKKSEYDRARVNLNSVSANLKLNESRYELALNKLKNAMGIDLQNELTISYATDFPIPDNIGLQTEFDASRLVAWQLDQKSIASKEFDVKKKNAAFLPTLSLQGKYGFNTFGDSFSNAYRDPIDFSAVGVKLSIPVFSGFKKSSQLSQSKLTLSNQRLTATVNQDTYRLDYQNSAIELQSSYSNFISTKENLQLAEEVVKATTIEYREGSADLTAYMDAESSFKEAQTDYTTSLLGLFTAKLAFEKANGTLIDYLKTL